jgi:hypothetical protein
MLHSIDATVTDFFNAVQDLHSMQTLNRQTHSGLRQPTKGCEYQFQLER